MSDNKISTMIFELGLLYFYASTSGSASAILMENSGYVLTETGGHILLE
jgi:hypothetical protein